MSASNGRLSFASIIVYICTAFALCTLLPAVLIPVLIYRWLLFKYVALFRRDLDHPLRGHGALALTEGPHVDVHMNILLVLKVRGALDLEKIKAVFRDRLVNAKGEKGTLQFSELQQYTTRWGGYFFWKWDPEFNLNEHIQLHTLVPGGDDIVKLQTEFLRKPLAENKSPWHVLVVDEGPTSSHHHILVKFHHSLTDGHAIRALMLCADEPAVFVKMPEQAHPPLAIRLSNFVKFPFRFVADFINFAKISSPALPWPAIPPESTCGIGTRHHFISVSMTGRQSMSMERVKRIAKEQGVSITAVLYAALTGGLRAFITQKYGPKNIPSHITIPQPVPVPGRPDGFVNWVGAITYQLPIGDPSAQSRLLSIERCLNERKQSTETIASKFCFDLMFSWLPYPLRADCKLLLPISTSNVPGPLEKVSIAGQEVEGMRALLGATPTNFYVAMFSYNGTMEWVCNGDTRVVNQQEVEHIGQLIGAEFENMAKLLRQ